MTGFKKTLELQVTAPVVCFVLLLFAVYDSYDIEIDEMETDWFDEEEGAEDTGEK
jgi:hypothetical protein